MIAKKYILLLLVLWHLTSYSQRIYLNEANVQVVSVVSDTNKIHATINYSKREINPKHSNRFYYSFGGNKIRKMQAGINGIPLHGEYKEFYADKSLKITGYFKKGLKHGVWKTWLPNGEINKVCKWRNGVKTKKCIELEGLLDSVKKDPEPKKKLAQDNKKKDIELKKEKKVNSKKAKKKEIQKKDRENKTARKNSSKNNIKENYETNREGNLKKEEKKKKPKKSWRKKILKKNQECPEIEKNTQ